MNALVMGGSSGPCDPGPACQRPAVVSLQFHVFRRLWFLCSGLGQHLLNGTVLLILVDGHIGLRGLLLPLGRYEM